MTAQPQSKHFLPTASRTAGNIFAPIQREFDRLFDQLGNGWNAFADIDIAPRMDVRDAKDVLEITVELPGVSKDDVKIAVDDNVLTISGEKRSEKQSKEGDVHVAERSYGAFSRSLALPSTVDGAKLAATLKDGVLTLTAPKVAGAQSKTIEIQSAS